jgi:flagellar hook protein FlgE
MGAISIGTTGLTASSKQMDVIGNNLANSNTLGFKASSTQFSSILSDSGTLAVGQGVGVSAITTQFSQGSFENTGNATDLAIDGEGFFMVKDNEGAVYCTRAGAFHINSAGYLVDTNDYQVQGYTASATDLDAVEEETSISLQNVQSAPKASTEISIGANLDEDAAYGDKFNVSQSVFDTKGKMHNLSIIFQKTEGQGMWGFEAKLDSTNISDTGVNQPACGVTFDSNGLLSGLYKGDVPLASIAAAAAVAAGAALPIATISRPGQLYKDTTLGGIVLAKDSATVWSVTADGGYTDILAWQESSGGRDYLRVDLDRKGGADIVFDLGASTITEVATVTFGALAGAANTVTVAGLTFTPTAVGASAAEVAAAFAAGATVDALKGAISGTLAGYTVAAGTGTNVVFTSTAAGTNVAPDLVATLGGGAAAPVINVVQGNTNKWATNHTVTFNIKKTEADLMDMVFAFGDLGNGAEIGVSDDTTNNQITWDITGDTANIITGYSSTSVIKSIRDNGYTSGVLKGLNIGRDGVISGFFTNGQTSNLSQIVLADFPNADGLMKIGSYFGETNESGGALKNRPGSASLGEIRSNSLEISNTDVAKEFINMITAQRAYQASSRIITTADQMLTELMNIKR